MNAKFGLIINTSKGFYAENVEMKNWKIVAMLRSIHNAMYIYHECNTMQSPAVVKCNNGRSPLAFGGDWSYGSINGRGS